MAREKTPVAGSTHVIAPIAVFRSPFASKFGVPRQSGLTEHLHGRIVLLPPYDKEEAIRGIEDFSHLWLIWGFSANKRQETSSEEQRAKSKGQDNGTDTPLTNQSPSLGEGFGLGLTVRPPRLGGNKRMGVFATRSPFRPNGLGLSSVRILKISSNEIEVAGADLMDNTPIYDIKPYLPYADSHPQALGGFTDTTEWQPLRVAFPKQWQAFFSAEEVAALTDVLAMDPRPHYHHSPDRVYGMTFAGRNVSFRVANDTVEVVEVTNKFSF